jgi:hypothetical protein
MSCLLCGSKKQAEFSAEMLIHWVQESEQTRRLVIPEAVSVLGLRLFANESASTRA